MAKFAQIIGFATPFASLAKDGKFATGSEVASTLFDPRKLGGGLDMFGALKPDKSKKSESSSEPTPLPQAPASSQIAEQAAENSRKRRRSSGSTKTVYTSPLGIKAEADVTKKTLTGQ